MIPQRLAILMYHRVLDRPDPLRPWETLAGQFRRHLWVLRRFFNVLPLGEAVRRLQAGRLPVAAVSITFDDGYRDNFETAWPILREFGLPATVFVATDFLDGGMMWNDRLIEAVRRTQRPQVDLSAFGVGPRRITGMAERLELCERLIDALKYRPPAERDAAVDAVIAELGAPGAEPLMMDAGQVRRLAQDGMSIGAHTRTHPILSRLPEHRLSGEIAGSRDRLVEITGAPVDLFAYPNGRPDTDFDARHVAAVEAAGFSAAVSTARGCARPGDDRFQLPRLGPWALTRLRFGAGLARDFLGAPARRCA